MFSRIIINTSVSLIQTIIITFPPTHLSILYYILQRPFIARRTEKKHPDDDNNSNNDKPHS